MAFGILESNEPQPRGTTLLEDIHDDGRTEVILVPQPSTSPSDPLNMSRLRKELAFATIVFGACTTGVIGPLLVPGFAILATSFNVTLTKVTLLNGALIMALGVGSFFCSIFAEVYGKRLVYLSTTILLIASSCWGAASQSYNSLLAARVFQGLGISAFFALAGSASINDLFFVHERGFRVGLWNFALIVSTNMAPIISGYVIVNLSWRWSFWLMAITFSVLLFSVVFLFPETKFNRKSTPFATANMESQGHNGTVVEKGPSNEVAVDSCVGTVASPKSPLLRVLGLGNIDIQDQSRIFKLCISSVVLLRHPAVIWGCMMWSVTFTWVIIQGAVATQIFAAPPYNMSATAVGNLIGIAPLIGAAFGTFFGGWSCDAVSQFLAKRNEGVFEPEFRMLVIIPSLITLVVGAFGLGVAIHNGLSAIICGVFLASINFSVGVGCTGIVSYTNDVCQYKAGEAFGLAMLVKSAFAFGLTFILNDYYALHGPKIFFFTWGSLTVGVMLFTIPMYVYGKRIRAWSDRVGII